MKVNQNKEFYLGFPNFETRKLCLYQSIISYHNLQIETGRYTKKNNQNYFYIVKWWRMKSILKKYSFIAKEIS
jgi:hypothetical protein